MSDLKSLCVYCSGSAHIADEYKVLARSVGEHIANENISVVYGGGKVGLMGEVAMGALDAGGKVYGIQTEHLNRHEVGYLDITELTIVPDMHVRKAKMFEMGDGFVILPGGFGTLEEAMEIVTWKQIGLHGKPIIFVNFNGFWDPFREQVNKFTREKFATVEDSDLFRFVESPGDIVPLMRQIPRDILNPTNKWVQ